MDRHPSVLLGASCRHVRRGGGYPPSGCQGHVGLGLILALFLASGLRAITDIPTIRGPPNGRTVRDSGRFPTFRFEGGDPLGVGVGSCRDFTGQSGARQFRAGGAPQGDPSSYSVSTPTRQRPRTSVVRLSGGGGREGRVRSRPNPTPDANGPLSLGLRLSGMSPICRDSRHPLLSRGRPEEKKRPRSV